MGIIEKGLYITLSLIIIRAAWNYYKYRTSPRFQIKLEPSKIQDRFIINEKSFCFIFGFNYEQVESAYSIDDAYLIINKLKQPAEYVQ